MSDSDKDWIDSATDNLGWTGGHDESEDDEEEDEDDDEDDEK